MDSSLLQFYVKALTSLKRAPTRFGTAPHKPILLITFFDLIEEGYITSNQIFVDVELVAKFQENWKLLVKTLHQADFTQPFFYMQNDKYRGEQFWFLKAKPGFSINSHIKNINVLTEVLDYGYFEPNLFHILKNPIQREFFKKSVLEKYFPDSLENYYSSKSKGNSYIQNLENLVLNEPIEPYKKVKTSIEEEIFVRSGVFKKVVPKIYKDTCSFTGLKLVSLHGYSLLDACHIVPFSENQNDTIKNGIALCPNMHRAFVRGLISIDQDFKVIVSKHIEENIEHPYSLSRLEGKRIYLPDEKKFHPSQDNLAWHREKVFKG